MRKLLLTIFGILLTSSALFGQGTANNTSDCSANNVPTPGCNGPGAQPFFSNPSDGGAQTTTVDPLPVDVSGVSVQTLFTTVGNPRVIAEVQPWWYNVTPFNGHQNIGMNLSTAAQALYQSQNIFARGFQVEAIDWYGCSDYCATPQSSTQHFNNEVTLAISTAIAANPTTTPKFLIMLDQGAINGTGTGQCPYATGSQACITSALETQMDYICATWCGQSYYELNAKNSHAIVMLFITKSNWTTAGINWSTIYSALAAHATAGQTCTPCSGGVYPVTVDLVDENAGAFGESGIMGGFAWPQPNAWSITQQFCWNDVGTPCSYNYLSGFYSAAQTQTSSVANTITVGGMWKGFDDHNASWGTNRVMAQQCGQVLNFTVGAIATAGYSSGTPLQYVMDATWNDYEEGTEVETGVNNCITINRPTISSGSIHWTLAKSDATYASTSTISKFQIWTGSTNPTTLFADNISPTATSAAAPTLAAGQSAWVYAVGMPLIQNQLSPTVAATYYIAANGNDANGGTSKTTPWLHAPGMPACSSLCAAHTPVPGDSFIFRGGDTWNYGNSGATVYTGGNWQWNSAWNGTATNGIYIGVDETWYTGSNWTRPVITGGNALSTAFVGSCTYDDSAVMGFMLNQNSYVAVDNLEWPGRCWSTGSANSAAIYSYETCHVTISNNYFHGWTAVLGGVDDQMILGNDNGSCGAATGNVIVGNLIDGSDSSAAAGGSGSCSGTFEPSYPCQSGMGIYSEGYDIHQNTFRYVSNMAVTVNTKLFHDNLAEYLYQSYDDHTHSNVLNEVTNATGASTYFYNNIVRHTYVTEDIYLTVGSGGSAYLFNNVFFDNLKYDASGDKAPTNCIHLQAQASTGTQTLYTYNNTFDDDTDDATGGGCEIQFMPAGAPTYAWNGTAYFQNNHLIGYPALSNLYVCDSGATCTIHDNGNEVIQTAALARIQGYTQAGSNDGPINSSGATVGAGANLTSLCSTFPTALCAGTSNGAFESTVNSVLIALYPTIATINRPTINSFGLNWTAGAYQWGVENPGNYGAYTGLAIVPQPSTPNMGGVIKNGAVAFDSSYPSGLASQVSRCTDQSLMASTGVIGNQSKSAGLGGSGDASQMWNQNSTMLHFNSSGGGGYLTLFNPTTMQCGDPVTGHAITADKNLSNPGSSSTVYQFGSGSFDWNNPQVWYTAGGDNDFTNTQVGSYTFNLTNGTFTVGSILADFIDGLPLGSNVPAWQASHAYTMGQYVSYAMQSSDSPRPFDWPANYSSYQLGDLIKPSIGNPAGCGFKLIKVGTTGSTEPTWGSTCTGNNITDGTAQWSGILGPPTFTYQLTSASGTSGSSTPAFVPTATGHPDIDTTITDSGLTWTNVGTDITQVSAMWASFGGVSEDGTRYCSAFSSNAYGYAGAYPADNADQGTGIWAICYSTTANQYVLLNTLTGIQSSTTCSGGSGYNCSGGTLTFNQEGVVSAIVPGCGTGGGFSIHNLKGSVTQDYPIVAGQVQFGSCQSGAGLVWNPFFAFNGATAGEFTPGLNHWAVGKNHLINVGQIGSLSGFSYGEYDSIFDLTQPTNNNSVNVSWQVDPCELPWVGNGTDASPPCQFSNAYDSHTSFAFNPGDMDTAPICGTVYNLVDLSPVPVAPWQSEEVCISSYPNWLTNPNAAPTPNPLQQEWRFTHTFATGTNKFFDTQFQISQLSHDGRFLAFSSDWNGTLGNTSGGTSVLFGYPWVPDTYYPPNSFVNPFSSTGGSGTNYGVWEIAGSPNISALTPPPWANCVGQPPGCFVRDAALVTYIYEGPSNDKGEVFIVKLAPSSMPPPAPAGLGVSVGVAGSIGTAIR